MSTAGRILPHLFEGISLPCPQDLGPNRMLVFFDIVSIREGDKIEEKTVHRGTDCICFMPCEKAVIADAPAQRLIGSYPCYSGWVSFRPLFESQLRVSHSQCSVDHVSIRQRSETCDAVITLSD